MNQRIIPSAAGLLIAAALCLAARGQYEARPLRGELSPLPYFATAGGREGKRFTEAAVNRYRLYDFYTRQAAHHLSLPPDFSGVLPPFPGLDGGRRGHWGGTNDRESGAYDRPQGPDFTAVTSRGGQGTFHLRIGPAEDPAVVVFNGVTAAFERFLPQGRMSLPPHVFGFAVDRFGMRLDLAGEASLVGSGADWRGKDQGAGRFAGYHLDGDGTVLRHEVDGARVLERVSLVQTGEARLLLRDIEFLDPLAGPAELRLPAAAAGETAWSATPDPVGAAVRFRGESGDRVALHRVLPLEGVTLGQAGGPGMIAITAAPEHGRLRLLSWGGRAGEAAAMPALMAAAAMPASAPVDALAGGPARFAEIPRVAGVLDADPEAKGSAYAIDDIPVPVEANPYRTPMTFSGLDFDSDGTAYLCTLVGDVWKVTGLTGDLRQVAWKRYAAGLDLPMGLVVVDGVPHVHARRFIFRLVDVNGDGEADFHQRFNRDDLPHADECGRDLRRDAVGNFYYNVREGIFRLNPSGAGLSRVGGGARNPFGLGVRADGLVLSDSSEGESHNGTCTLYESHHAENGTSVAKHRRLLYLPRGIDNSPGSRLFLDDPRFGPLGKSILGVSYGAGSWYAMVRDVVDGTPQAALLPMPGAFASGTCRTAVQPVDGQVFVAGLDGWGDQAVAEGSLHRIRWTGADANVITGWRAHRNGILIRFSRPPESLPDASLWFVQQWNYIDSAKTYGSLEYSVRQPEVPGHDRLEVRSVRALPGAAVFLEIPALRPAMCTHLHVRLAGDARTFDAYFTLNRLAADHPAGAASDEEKPAVLVVPERDANGDTYQNLITHFDQLSGRTTADRPETPALSYRAEDLGYAWLRRHLLDAHCLPCHGSGTQHDFSTREGLLRKVDLRQPDKSPLLGMLETKSMPPYPLPSVHATAVAAIREWIRRGAGE